MCFSPHGPNWQRYTLGFVTYLIAACAAFCLAVAGDITKAIDKSDKLFDYPGEA